MNFPEIGLKMISYSRDKEGSTRKLDQQVSQPQELATQNLL